MAEKKDLPAAAAKRSVTRAAKKPERSIAAPVIDEKRLLELTAELRDMRERVELLSQRLDTSERARSSRVARLGELGETLERTVDEVRRAQLDREKLLALASTIAAIARVLGEALASST